LRGFEHANKASPPRQLERTQTSTGVGAANSEYGDGEKVAQVMPNGKVVAAVMLGTKFTGTAQCNSCC
jgi:hypothetical protein